MISHERKSIIIVDNSDFGEAFGPALEDLQPPPKVHTYKLVDEIPPSLEADLVIAEVCEIPPETLEDLKKRFKDASFIFTGCRREKLSRIADRFEAIFLLKAFGITTFLKAVTEALDIKIGQEDSQTSSLLSPALLHREQE